MIRLILSEWKREQHELAYRVYVTDALKVLTENTAKYAGGAMIKIRYYDMIADVKKQKDEKSGDEIVADIVTRAGLEIV